MNKKGFTLVELLAVIAVIAILSLIAIPNIINIVDNIKKNNMVDDAKKLISIAKMKVNEDYDIRKKTSHKFTFSVLNETKEIAKDPDGGDYNTGSYVLYSKTADGVVNYCIYLQSSKRRIGTGTACVNEIDLYDRDVVK